MQQLFALEPHGVDTFVGAGREYPWGGLYGGHIVAQALWAAAETVEPDMEPHSLRAYFIRRGSPKDTVRYEVDRIRKKMAPVSTWKQAFKDLKMRQMCNQLLFQLASHCLTK